MAVAVVAECSAWSSCRTRRRSAPTASGCWPSRARAAICSASPNRFRLRDRQQPDAHTPAIATADASLSPDDGGRVHELGVITNQILAGAVHELQVSHRGGLFLNRTSGQIKPVPGHLDRQQSLLRPGSSGRNNGVFGRENGSLSTPPSSGHNTSHSNRAARLSRRVYALPGTPLLRFGDDRAASRC
jgi:hypothetical protein